ncbi:MAG: DUF222 domain-containing protein, partial [Actinomycetota bacterium]|nr:DUF222 domain-containing protein [Actinomycetota bacterium]
AHTDAALAAGRITLAHAAVLSQALRQVGPQVMAWAEEHLITIAELTDPPQLREAVQQLRERLDPDALERDYVESLDRRHFSVAKVGDGYALSGFLDPEAGCLVATAMAALAGRRGLEDTRSPGERRADALTDLCRAAVEEDPAPDAGADGGCGRDQQAGSSATDASDADHTSDPDDASDAGTGNGQPARLRAWAAPAGSTATGRT